MARTPGIFNKEKMNNRSIDQRWWTLGAHINAQGNVEIYRSYNEQSSRYFKSDGTDNKCLVLNQNDSTNNPEALEIINAGSGNAIVQRAEAEDTTLLGRLTKAGVWTDGSSQKIKKGFKNMSDKVAEKQLKSLEAKSYKSSITDEPGFGPTAENFREVTGIGDGESIAAGDMAGLAIRYCQLLLKKIESLEGVEKKGPGRPKKEESEQTENTETEGE